MQDLKIGEWENDAFRSWELNSHLQDMHNASMSAGRVNANLVKDAVDMQTREIDSQMRHNRMCAYLDSINNLASAPTSSSSSSGGYKADVTGIVVAAIIAVTAILCAIPVIESMVRWR